MQDTLYTILSRVVKKAAEIQKEVAKLNPECAILLGPLWGQLERAKSIVEREEYNRVVESFNNNTK